MKKIILFIFTSFIFTAIETAELNVRGMMCGVGCVNKIQTQVNEIDGVDKCEISYEKGEVVVSYDKNITTKSKIVKTLNNNTTYAFSEKDESNGSFKWFLNIFGL